MITRKQKDASLIRIFLFGVVLVLMAHKLNQVHLEAIAVEDEKYYAGLPEPQRQEMNIEIAPKTLPFIPEEGKLATGNLSDKPKHFFQDIQFRIDNVHPYDRCRPYKFLKKGIGPDEVKPVKRKIFFGALIADESWELMEIMATETYQIFEGMVFVESNRTQSFTPRPLQRQDHVERYKELFGTEKVQIRNYVNEDSSMVGLGREQEQRQEILKGWKELGMTENDVGYLADMDESFTRDFLRALQECPHVEFLDYKSHHCNPLKARINGAARVFEAFPDCIAKDRAWYHPDVIIGSCIELIGNGTIHPTAPREYGFQRMDGFGGQRCDDEGFRNITDGMFPLYSASDFRANCGGGMVRHKKGTHAEYTAFHLHNFFPLFNQTRFKYKTYGHPMNHAFTSKLVDMHGDLELVTRCAHNVSNDEPSLAKTHHNARWKREEGGLGGTKPSWPIYFHDEDYRERKAKDIRKELLADEISRQNYMKSLQVAELARRAKLLKGSKVLSV